MTHIFLDLNYGALVSLGKLCDYGCIVEPTKENINVTKRRYMGKQKPRNKIIEDTA